MSTNKILTAIVLILIIFFSIFKKKSNNIENFSSNQQCKTNNTNNENCKKCAYPKLHPCKPQPCKPQPCEPVKPCKPQCKPDCPDMKRYILKSKIPPCPDFPDMSAYILKSEIPPCPPQPDLTKYVLKTTVPPCKCPPCPKVDCPKLPKVITPDCPKMTKYLEQLSRDLVNERKRANQLQRDIMNNGCKISSYSEKDLKKIVEFYEHYKSVSKKYNENIRIKERGNKKCKLVANDSFGSATGLSMDSITNPYNYISNNSANYGINQNINLKHSESFKMHQSISEKYKSILDN